jgi:hypothetical protein
MSAGDLTMTTGELEMNDAIHFDTGVAATGARYEILRNNDAGNRLQFNVPTSALFEWTVNNVDSLRFSGTQLQLRREYTGPVELNVFNTHTSNSAADVRVQFITGGPSAGDPFIEFGVTNGATRWSVGVDNDGGPTDDLFAISNSGVGPGTGDALRIAATSLDVEIVAGDLTMTAGDIDMNDTGTLLNVGAPIQRNVNAGLTASTSQSQGQGALTAEINEVSTCANDDDTVTLPTAAAGLKIVIINNGANRLQIFPASSDNLGAGANSSLAGGLVAGENITFIAYDATNWEEV